MTPGQILPPKLKEEDDSKVIEEEKQDEAKSGMYLSLSSRYNVLIQGLKSSFVLVEGEGEGEGEGEKDGDIGLEDEGFVLV